MKHEAEIEVEIGSRIFTADIKWEVKMDGDGDIFVDFETTRIVECFGDDDGEPNPPLTTAETDVLAALIKEKWEGEMESESERRHESQWD